METPIFIMYLKNYIIKYNKIVFYKIKYKIIRKNYFETSDDR